MNVRPKNSPDCWTACLNDLDQEGVHVFDLRRWFPDRWEHGIEAALRAAGGVLEDISGDHVSFCPTGIEIHRMALDRSLLKLVSEYLDADPAVTAIHYRRDGGPEVAEDLRCWHVDFEDRRMLRLITYLHKVDDTNGAFQYIPHGLSDRCEPLLKQGHGDAETNPYYAPIDDDLMRSCVSSDAWRTVRGYLATTVIADTARLFHRTKPHGSIRKALTITYTSRRPRFPELHRNSALDHVLDEQQTSCFYASSPHTIFNLGS